MADRSFQRYRDQSPPGDEPLYTLPESALRAMMADALQTIYVDSGWYMSTYPDVEEAIRAGSVTSAEMHYVSYGFFEGRQPFEIVVDSTWYFEKYADVRRAVGEGAFADAQNHFNRIGFEEGRQPYKNFKLFGTAFAHNEYSEQRHS